MSKTKTKNGIDIHVKKINPDADVICQIRMQLFGKPEWEFDSADEPNAVIKQIRAKSTELFERLQQISEDVEILLQNGWDISEFGDYYDVVLHKDCRLEDAIKDLKDTSKNVVIEEQEYKTGELLRSYPAGYIQVS